MKYTKKTAFEAADAFGIGAPNDTYAQYFIGQSFLKPLTEPEKAPVFHHATKGGGQILICTAGEGWYQEEGKPAVSLKAGTVITIPAEVKHWHGAKKDSWFSHIAVECPGENCSNEWCEPVSDAEYEKLELAE